MKISLNPIIKKDIKVSARSMKMAWGLMAYEALLAFIFIMVLSVLSLQSGGYNGYSNTYRELISLFPWIGIMQVGMTALTIPIMTASSISGEKERQTFDIMLTTCLSPGSIVFGKVFSSVAEVMLYVIASIPIMALAFVLGGLSWWTLLLFFVVIFVFATLTGSIGVFCSSISRKSIVSIILAFVGYFLICFLTVLPMIITMFATKGEEVYDSVLFLLLNPIVFLEEFFMLSMRGESLFSDHSNVGFFAGLICHGPLWCILSGICMLGLSLFFMFLAARRIDPLTGRVGRNARKQPIVQCRAGTKNDANAGEAMDNGTVAGGAAGHADTGNEAQDG